MAADICDHIAVAWLMCHTGHKSNSNGHLGTSALRLSLQVDVVAYISVCFSARNIAFLVSTVIMLTYNIEIMGLFL